MGDIDVRCLDHDLVFSHYNGIVDVESLEAAGIALAKHLAKEHGVNVEFRIV
jgi:hypothetical protein